MDDRVSDTDMSRQQAEADLAQREARASELEAELAAERAEIEQIKIYLKLAQRYGAGSPTYAFAQVQQLNHLSNPLPQEGLPSDDEPLIEACRGKSIPDAAIALIRLAGRPLSELEIVDQLRRAKVTIVSKTPELNLRFALLRKRKETGAVKLTKDKKHWELDDNPNLQNGAYKRSAFFENRQRNNHAERSRQGLLAARQRGTKNGRRPTYTDEQIRDAMTAREAGATWEHAASSIGISVTRLQARIRELEEKVTAEPQTPVLDPV
jgi:hypothetical protein